ncbi:MAG: 50S ribosomal protein L25 [Bacillota bacterium]
MEHLIKVNKRSVEKTPIKTLRKQGQVPAVVYGKKINMPLSVESKELERSMRHGLVGKLVRFESGDKELHNQLAIFQDYQVSPLTGRIIHVDFHAVKSDDVIETHVGITFTGEERRKNDGSIIEFHLREIRVQCRPADIPEHVVCDVSEVQTGDKILAGSLKLGEGVTLLTPASEVILLAVIPRAKLEETPQEEPEKVEETEPAVESPKEKE